MTVHVDHNQIDPLPFIIIYTNCASSKLTECLCNHKATILVCMISSGKVGDLTGYGLHGYSLASVIF